MTVEIICDDGFLTLSAIKNGVKTRLFHRVEDHTFSGGKIGVATSAAVARFDDITADNAGLVTFSISLTREGSPAPLLSQLKGQAASVDFLLKNNRAGEVAEAEILVTVSDEAGVLRGGWRKKLLLGKPDNGAYDIAIPVHIPADATDGFTISAYYWDSLGRMQPLANRKPLHRYMTY